ncbi:MAG: DUF4184 family protein [Actinomycetales bacterium]
MPATVAHVAAVLPIARFQRDWLVPSAWVIGSIVPDMAWVLFGQRAYYVAHSALGIVTFDVGLGVTLLAAWRWLLAEPVRDVLPRAIGERIPAGRGIRGREWPGVVIGLAAGALTHVVWDSFTHVSRWGSTHVPGLSSDLGGLPGYQWAQHVSSLVGTVIVAWFLWRRFHETPPTPVADRRATRWFGPASTLALVLIASATAALAWASAETTSTHDLFFRVTLRSSAALFVGVLGCGVLWWRLPQRDGERRAKRSWWRPQTAR